MIHSHVLLHTGSDYGEPPIRRALERGNRASIGELEGFVFPSSESWLA